MDALNTSPLVSAEEQAAWRWLLQRHDPAIAWDEARFERWLAADPAHPPAYARAEALWMDTAGPARQLADEDDVVLQQYLQRLEAPAIRWRRWPLPLASAALLLLALWLGAGSRPENWLDNLRADQVTAPGEIRELTLAEGSRLVLDADTAIEVRLTAEERHVWLLRGAAFFEVTHTGQPFVVHSGSGQIQVLGTAFEVRQQPSGHQVSVASGRVRVVDGRVGVELQAGQQTRFLGGQLQPVATVDPRHLLDWRGGWLSFYRAPLTEVLARLGQYFPGRIILLDPALSGQRVTGSFPGRDPAAALAGLQALLGFRLQNLPGQWVLIF